MKRIISIALVALMLVALALPVIAATTTVTIPEDSTSNSTTGNVTVSVTEAAGSEPVYKVNVAWEDAGDIMGYYVKDNKIVSF